jgi:hypothetical protein
MKDKALYIIIGVLIGVIIMQWQQGPQPAQAQAPEVINGYRVVTYNTTGHHFVMLSNGDVYKQDRPLHEDSFGGAAPKYMGNFWSGAPVPTSNSSWGEIKGRTGSEDD